jgi:hypothetical protein
VTATTTEIRTASASAGPKARIAGDRATTRADTPATIVAPATSTIGANVAVVRLAASSRSRPCASSARIPDRK